MAAQDSSQTEQPTTPKNPNRIEQTTMATPEITARLGPTVNPSEGNYWTPGKVTMLVVTVAVALLASVGSVLATGVVTPAALVAASITGLSTGLAAFFGIKSGGSPK